MGRMSGSSSGPLRKSHTKSKNGCRRCKERHIRCDESFPQWYVTIHHSKKTLQWKYEASNAMLNFSSQNCTKYRCRCSYQDGVAIQTEVPSTNPVLAPQSAAEWTSRTLRQDLAGNKIEIELDNWLATGEPPFPELLSYPRNVWYTLSRSDLHLLYHIVDLSLDLDHRGLGHCAEWARNMPR